MMSEAEIKRARLDIQTAIEGYGRQCASNVEAAHARQADGVSGILEITGRQRGEAHALNCLKEAMNLVGDLIFELQKEG